PQSESALVDLQERHDLVAHGIADEPTKAKVEELMTMDMQRGLYRQDVVPLKEDLVKLSFASWSNPTIYYGPQTEGAVKDFQEYYGLETTGVAGEETLEKIDEVLNSPVQRPNRNEES
ncbi:peptidoglycan-binding domain-containing protein, partial [Alkalibacillus haloalkaliphilus]|uniref:peptidoglycan-binding domain-containing protein n=1 Tax=Alkalibacillus haloalkaliphilus TaxID=94136 RepID=UPI0004951B32